MKKLLALALIPAFLFAVASSADNENPIQITPLEISVNGNVTVFHLDHTQLHGQAIHIIVSGDEVEAREEQNTPILPLL